MSRTVVIVEKDGMFGLLSLDRKPETTTLTNFDPRSRSAYFRSYGDPAEAGKDFNEALATTRDRGWSVVWSGAPNWG